MTLPSIPASRASSGYLGATILRGAVGVSNAIIHNEFDGRRRDDGAACPRRTTMLSLMHDLRPIAGADRAGQYAVVTDNTFFNMCGFSDCGLARTEGVGVFGYDLGDIRNNTFLCQEGRSCDTVAIRCVPDNRTGPLHRLSTSASHVVSARS